MRETWRWQLAELLVSLHWWPPGIDFDVDDLATVAKVLANRNKRGGRQQ
jgi:hypothetical protein